MRSDQMGQHASLLALFGASRHPRRLLSVAISSSLAASSALITACSFVAAKLFVPLPSPPRSVPPLPLALSTSVDCLLSTLHLPCRRPASPSPRPPVPYSGDAASADCFPSRAAGCT